MVADTDARKVVDPGRRKRQAVEDLAVEGLGSWLYYSNFLGIFDRCLIEVREGAWSCTASTRGALN